MLKVMMCQCAEESAATSLDARDYRNLLSVLADASGFSDYRFFEQLGESLSRHLGWTDAVVLDLADVSPLISENGVTKLSDLFGRIDAGAAGSALIRRNAPDEASIDEREIALMELLAQYLSPRLREYFVRSKEVRDGSSLTDREAQVVRLVAQGMSNRLIAAELHIRVDTVKKHVMSAMQKTGAGNRTQLALIHLRS
ncbi:helix-turn-helix transcriptional regulator [Catenulispora acidiphila]|nr:LuxR C-terminal-related transcriptional regulator [Catenulispora acidiphila]